MPGAIYAWSNYRHFFIYFTIYQKEKHMSVFNKVTDELATWNYLELIIQKKLGNVQSTIAQFYLDSSFALLVK